MTSAASTSQTPDVFRLLYPEEFYSKFYAAGVRPDGRPLGRARQTSINLGAAASADGSSLVKIGNTTVRYEAGWRDLSCPESLQTILAGIKLEVAKPTSESPCEGFLEVEFHMPPLCSPFNRPGRLPETAYGIAEQLSNGLDSSGVIDRKELCIEEGKAVWVARLDVYCLDADGALLDAAMLASVAALANLRFPVVSLDENDRVIIEEEASRASDAEGSSGANPFAGKRVTRLSLRDIPVCLTCGLFKSYLLADPSAEEEKLAESVVSVILNSELHLVSLYKPGGGRTMTLAKTQDCISTARLRRREVCKMLDSAK